MSDLVERLRSGYFSSSYKAVREAADRIEKLEAENKQLLAELEGWRKDAMAVVVKPQGMTTYNLLQADEDAISAKLIELGWTPPDPKEKG